MDPSHMNRQNLIENDKNLIDKIDAVILPFPAIQRYPIIYNSGEIIKLCIDI